MTPRERAEAVAVLRQWAEWCEAEKRGWFSAWCVLPTRYEQAETLAEDVAREFCGSVGTGHYWRGHVAATGLLLAAAMVAAGDGCD